MENTEKLELISRNTEEIITREELQELLKKDKISAYIGRATSGPLHLGHIVSLSKMLDLQKAGIEVIILIADIHAALDDQKAKWEELDKKAEYTEKSIELSLKWIKKPKFVRGSEFQLKKEYQYDVLRASTFTTVERAIRAASEVTRMKNPKVSELIYPIMQSLDEEYLGVDIQVGGRDQRHIFGLAREILPILGYRKRVEILLPLITSLEGPGKKMSSSSPNSRIKVHDKEESIIQKINNAYCPEGVIVDNPILQISKYLIFPNFGKVYIERPSNYGGNVEYKSYEELEKDYQARKLHPKDLKMAVAKLIVELFKEVREYWEKRKDFLESLGPDFL
ncbi:MAG: tyrosine--tRNA ligase [Candidatus Rehaiarchaeum fermentans]|nr:tyrosine--tRNA ligase [Candidatus Rehaiarchaeum fermentans]